MQKNVAGQKWVVFAFGRTSNSPITGDAANITANLRLDAGASNPVDDTNPAELERGYYAFDLTQAETNADLLTLCPASATADVLVIGVPGAVWTELAAAGVGAIAWTYTVTNSSTGLPIADVDVWVTSDAAGANVLASGRTDASGVVTFYLDAGAAYFWSQKSGFNFTNPDREIVA